MYIVYALYILVLLLTYIESKAVNTLYCLVSIDCVCSFPCPLHTRTSQPFIQFLGIPSNLCTLKALPQITTPLVK